MRDSFAFFLTAFLIGLGLILVVILLAVGAP